MEEIQRQEPTYSSERPELTSVGTPPEPPKTGEPSRTEQPGQFSSRMRETPLSSLLDSVWNLRHLSLAELLGFLKRTSRLWLTAAAVLFGLFALVTMVQRASVWAKNARERRHELAVATVTPDRLIARCGEAAQDATREVFPIVMRTMRYQTSGNRQLVVAFSRTAEEKSDWVFLSMNDEAGTGSYDTPDEKIAALPCLDSKK